MNSVVDHTKIFVNDSKAKKSNKYENLKNLLQLSHSLFLVPNSKSG